MKRNLLSETPKMLSEKKSKLNLVLYIVVTISFIVPIIYLTLRIAFGSTAENEAGYHSDADYVLMIVQCALGLLVINVPTILARRFHFELPMILYTMYIVFLYCAIFLGEVRSFYYNIPHWDVILHAFSSMMTGFFGFMVITILNRNEKTVMNLSPAFVVLFAFCFSVMIGSVWEIYEFTFDGVLGLNMQKFMTNDGTVLVGRQALLDTMKDIIVDVIGAIIASTIGYFSIKNEKQWLVPKLTDIDEDNKEKK